MAFNWRRPRKGEAETPNKKDSATPNRNIIQKYENRIIELEKKVELLAKNASESQEKVTEMSRLLAYTINSQKQLSLDMNVVYESITNVAETLQASASPADDDEKYFKWRWNINDDDDLPN